MCTDSSYGHTRSLVEAAAEGIRSTGASVDILKVKETLPEEVQGKMHIDHGALAALACCGFPRLSYPSICD